MSFKIHLIIIGFIILAVFFAWEWMEAQPPAVPPPVPAKASAFSIAVVHASLGLNCRNILSNGMTQDDSYKEKIDRLRNDNVLAKVSALCNGQMQCDIPQTTDVLGDDPFPECGNKMLEVEYRCFSYDRLRLARKSSDTLTISCENAADK